ncbi:nitrilase-related carbon-nitrogen hydrolase [Bacillota bacterium LX-D]|nr:nitrilase-related carbon-nitrogen hydrolase [Bacillota bacterium LX-D]
MSILTSAAKIALQSYLTHKCKPEIINSYLKQFSTENKVLTNTAVDLTKVKVAAVQLKLDLVDNVIAYAELMRQKVEAAALAGAQLIVFPEDNTLQLLGLLPGVGILARKMPKTASNNINTPLNPQSILRFLSPFAYAVYQTTFSTLAKMYGLFILGGSFFFLNEKQQLVNRALLFDPQGNLVGQQDKANLLPLESTWGLGCGADFKVYPTSLSNLALPICMDATYFETFRLLTLLGADLIMLPTANPEEFNYWRALRGIWPRVQESPVYGVKSALVCPNFFGLTFTGKAGIYGPLELTPQEDGIVREAKTWNQEEIVFAELNILNLRSLRQKHEYYGYWNQELYEKYFPKIYCSD